MPHGDLGHVYAGNMSKFFDFHKNQQQNQQQQSQQQFMMNGHSNPLTEQLNMSNMMDNSRVNSNFGDHSSGMFIYNSKCVNFVKCFCIFRNSVSPSQAANDEQIWAAD